MAMQSLKYHPIRKALVSIKAEEIFPSYPQDKNKKPSCSFLPKFVGCFGFVGVFLFFVVSVVYCEENRDHPYSWPFLTHYSYSLLFPYSFRGGATCDMGVAVDPHRS